MDYTAEVRYRGFFRKKYTKITANGPRALEFALCNKIDKLERHLALLIMFDIVTCFAYGATLIRLDDPSLFTRSSYALLFVVLLAPLVRAAVVILDHRDACIVAFKDAQLTTELCQIATDKNDHESRRDFL